jgi:hypothetical protein
MKACDTKVVLRTPPLLKWSFGPLGRMLCDMTTARFTPRSYCTAQAHFGNRREVAWLYASNPSGSQIDQLRAAQIQHHVAFGIRSALHEFDMSVQDYADQVGVTANRMGRMLRGQIVMKLEDIAAAERLLDLQPLKSRAITNGDDAAPDIYQRQSKVAREVE